MPSSLAGSVRIARASVQKAFSCQLLLCLEGYMFGVGFKLRRPPAKQQGPGSQRQPRPSLPSGDQRARGEKGQRGFAEQRRIGAVVCSPRRVELSRMQLRNGVLNRGWIGASVWTSLTGSGGIAGACVQTAFSCQLLLLHEEANHWSGFPSQETTSKTAGPREPEAAQPHIALWRPEG